MKVLYLPGQHSNWSDKITLEGEILFIEDHLKQAFSTDTISARPSWEINSNWEEIVSFCMTGGGKKGTSQKLTWVEKKEKSQAVVEKPS